MTFRFNCKSIETSLYSVTHKGFVDRLVSEMFGVISYFGDFQQIV